MHKGHHHGAAQAFPGHERRLQAVRAVIEGRSMAEAARETGVTRQAVHRWVGLWRREGFEALRSRRRGRPVETPLAPWQEERAAGTIALVQPNRLGLPYRSWSKRAVAVFVERAFGVALSRWMAGSYLRRWGLATRRKIGGIPGGASCGPLPWAGETSGGPIPGEAPVRPAGGDAQQ